MACCCSGSRSAVCPTHQAWHGQQGKRNLWHVCASTPARGCWQGTTASPCGVARGHKQEPSRETSKYQPSSLPEPGTTYPQMSNVPSTGPHMARSTRRHSKYTTTSGMSAARNEGSSPPAQPLPQFLLIAHSVLSSRADVTEGLVPGPRPLSQGKRWEWWVGRATQNHRMDWKTP